jgi:hypothetical protein
VKTWEEGGLVGHISLGKISIYRNDIKKRKKKTQT